MIIKDFDQRSPEWIAWRREGITATDISALMGLNPYSIREDIMFKKLGREGLVSKSMRRGARYEPEALEKAIEVLGLPFKPLCAESSANTLFRASLDGYCEKIVVEIKVPQKKNFPGFLEKQLTKDIYHWQVKWQMMVTEAFSGYLFVYDPITRESDYEKIILRLEDIELMQGVALEFWDDFNLGVI